MTSEATRRRFLQQLGVTSAGVLVACQRSNEVTTSEISGSAAAGAAPSGPPPAASAAPDLGEVKLAMAGPVPRRKLGRTGAEVSVLALGGFHLGTLASQAEATRLVHEALDHGIDFFDNAWEYHDGKSETYLGQALKGRRGKAFVMTKVCTHGRDAKVAMRQLEESLKRLETDVIDLWQVHEVIYDSDPELHARAGGVLEALARAKEQGKVRFVGFTGHKHPDIHLAMLRTGFAFDSCQLPINCFDGAGFRSFERQVLPELERRGIAALGMKSLGGEGEPVRQGVISAEEALGYALSLPVAAIVSGIDSGAVLRQNLNVAGGFEPWPEARMEALRKRLREQAADGRFELFKTSQKYDGKIGREQHGFPSDEELAG